MASGLSGCNDPLHLFSPAPAGAKSEASAAPSPGGVVRPPPIKPPRPVGAPSVHRVSLAFDVLRADLPVSDVRHSRKIWNHVDESRLDSAQVARLERNGVRIGVATSASWPPIRTILAATGAQTRQDHLLAQGDVPLLVSLGSVVENESYFSYGRHNRLVGKSFQAGERIIQFDFGFHAELGGLTELRVSFEIRHESGATEWKNEGGIIRQVPSVTRHVFEEMTAGVTLSNGEFLIVGPGLGAENSLLAGSRFFAASHDGEPYEVILILTPQPFQTDVTPSQRG